MDLTAATMVIALAIALAVGVAILGGSAGIGGSASTQGTDCESMAGYVPEHILSINRTVSPSGGGGSPPPSGPCYRTEHYNVTVNQTFRAAVWNMTRMECVSAGQDTRNCDNERTAALHSLDAGGYVNFKQQDRCESGTTSHGIAVARSVPVAAARQELGYCFGRAWTGGDAYYLTTYTHEQQVNLTRQVNETRTRQVQTTCPAAPQFSYQIVNVTVPAGAVPGSWAAACLDARESAQTGYAILTVAVVIAAAAVVLVTLRRAF